MTREKSTSGTDGSTLLNPEKIAERRRVIDPAELRGAAPGKWLCHYCTRRFSSEVVYERHSCQERDRQLFIKSPQGQAAYSYYSHWMRARKFSQQSVSTFLTSRSFQAIKKFAELVVAANIGDPIKYIDLMVEHGLQPALWTSQQAYRIYLDWADELSDPIEQVTKSIEFVFDLAEKEGADPFTIFQHLGSQRTLSLINQRRLSPWFLFHCRSFQQLITSLTETEKQVFSRALRADSWAEKLKEAGDAKAQVKDIVKQLGF